MKKGYLSLSIISGILVMFVLGSCKTEPDPIVQKSDYWVVLDVEDAKKEDDSLSWEYEVNKPGKYNVQLVTKGKDVFELPILKVISKDMELQESPRKIFVLDSTTSPKTIFQFKKDMVFKEPGRQTLKIDANPMIDQIRIMPRYTHKLGFGSGKYASQWKFMHDSPEKQETLDWLKEAKYGMFIHWGLYAQAGGIWKGTKMEDSPYPGPNVAEWLMYKFRIPREEYATLAKDFNPDSSFAESIAKLAKDAGMKYVVITAKHHDGFALFDSKCSEYDMVDATPYNADAIKELYDACLKEGLKFGVYYSHGNDWFNGADGNFNNVKKVNDSMGILSHAGGKNLWDPSPNTHAEYVEGKAYSQVKELVEIMPELAVMWFDGEGYITEEQAFQFYKMIYDGNPKVLVNRRVGYDFGDYLDAGDNVIPSSDDKLLKYWETCGTTNNSWAYKSYDNDWKSTPELLYYLVDIASKGGNYLLNIGPDGKGNVPEASAKGLLEVGKWLKINGDCIYGTSRWKIVHEGQDETLLAGTGHRAAKGFQRTFTQEDFWFTSKENRVYAISLANPTEELSIKSLNAANGPIAKVEALGTAKVVDWSQEKEYLKVVLENVNENTLGMVLEITLKNE